jgi:phosphatidyl-myo-inositol alpha-mannosyltransferase
MRIALVTEYYHPHLGGVTEHVQALSRELRLRGHEGLVVTAQMQGQDPLETGVRRVGRSQVIFNNGAFARVTLGSRLKTRMEEVLRSESIDLVHLHGPLVPTLGLVGQAAAARLGIPVVGTFHSWFPRSVGYRVFHTPLQRRLSAMTGRIAVSSIVVDAMSRYFHADFDIIPNGIDVIQFHPDGRRPGAVGPADPPRLLFVGRLDPRNGLGTLLRAMPAVLAAYPQAVLTVAGDGPLRAHYQRLARDLGDRVRFVGRIYEERAAYYGGCDLYLAPTRRASFGITLLEAMACGAPVLAADLPGHRLVIGDTGAGVLVDPERPSAWSEAILQLLGAADGRLRMRRQGLARAAAFAWHEVADRVIDVYRRSLR